MLRAVCQNTLPFHSHRKITARFDGGSLTSDAGWLLFGSVDRQHRLCEGFSSCISESRDQRYIRRSPLLKAPTGFLPVCRPIVNSATISG